MPFGYKPYFYPKLATMNSTAEVVITQALLEDIMDMEGRCAPGDHTSLACIPVDTEGKARLICKAEGILAGVDLAEIICEEVDRGIKFEKRLNDGTQIKHGDIAFIVYGEVKSLLRAERVILNFMQRMSGIATHTSKFVKAVEGTGTTIIDTRKTAPALRYFEKWAVRIGGGQNNRYGLFDMIMLKDNHIDFCGGISKAIMAVKNYQEKNKLKLPVEIEARNLADVEEILKTGHVTRIMFDNFSIGLLKEGVAMVNKQYQTEASGGITLNTVRTFAETGIDYISVGAITHSSASLDLSLKAF